MKKLARAVLFCLILAFCIAALNRILMPDTDFSAETKGGLVDEPDYMMLGTSNIFYNVNPLIIWKEEGFVGYNVSSEQAPLIISYYALKQELKERKPKAVFLDCGAFEYNYGKPSFNQLSLNKMPFSFDKMELIRLLGEDDENNQIKARNEYPKKNYYLPLLKFHDRWKDALDGNLKSRYHDKYEHTFMGYVAEKSVYVYEKDYKWLPTLEEFGGTWLTEVSDLNREHLHKIRTLCEENGAELILFKTPSKGWILEMNEAMKEFAKEEGLVFFDMNESAAIEQIGIDEQRDFADSSSHFNVYGAEKVSRYLADYMRETALFTDKRDVGFPAEAAWEALYEDYMTYKNTKGE